VNVEDARQLMARAIPVDLATRAFGVDLDLLRSEAKDGMITLGRTFALARRQAEARLRAVRFAHRSAFMRARLAAGRAARAYVDPARLALALTAFRVAVAASCEDLADRLRPFLPRLADLADRAAKAVLTVDPATARRPAGRAAR
jgi:hypothetical protein